MKLIVFFLIIILPSTSALDFLYNSFLNSVNDTYLTLIKDAVIDTSIVRLTNDSNMFSIGRAFYPTPLTMKPSTSNSSSIASFSTSFVFSILPEISTGPAFGLAFVLSNSTSPASALASQYFGLFSNAVPFIAPLLAIEFDIGRNPELNDRKNNHVGIKLNNIESAMKQVSGYYNSTTDEFIPVNMKNGQNIHAWIEFDGTQLEINVTIAPVGMPKPIRPLLKYRDPAIANYVSTDMYVGFSASKTTWVEAQRILAWSLSDTGVAKDINTSNLPVFMAPSSSSSLSAGAIVGVAIGSAAFVILCLFGYYWFWESKKTEQEEDHEIEDWELEYWPHRFLYEELSQATNGFSNDELLGKGGFGKVYKATLANNTEVAVKCINHDSKQGLREFMAEISTIGRLQHKNLVHMRGWCRKDNELMLVYDYMPNGSLDQWIFNKPLKLLSWDVRRIVLADVAEGLNYLHNGWDQVVIHRDIKSSNVLLDSKMRGRVGDFGLAKLHLHGEAPNTSRVVGTFGYLAPELAPTTASDVYSFGVVVLEVACGRRCIERRVPEEEEVLIKWVRDLYAAEKLFDAADERIKGEYEVEEMGTVLKLGLACCHPNPLRRPTMKEVLSILMGDGDAAAPAALLSELASDISGILNGGGYDTVVRKDDGDDNVRDKLPPV